MQETVFPTRFPKVTLFWAPSSRLERIISTPADPKATFTRLLMRDIVVIRKALRGDVGWTVEKEDCRRGGVKKRLYYR